MGFAEVCSRAFRSDDLTLLLDKRCDADTLIALGWASMRYPLGSTLARLYLGDDRVDVYVAVLHSRHYCDRMRSRWDLPKGARWWDRFAEAGVAHWLDPVCRSCKGRKFESHEGTPHLLARVCAACRGKGRRRYPVIGGERIDEHDRWNDRFGELLTHLDTQVETALNAARRLLTAKGYSPSLSGNKNNKMPDAALNYAGHRFPQNSHSGAVAAPPLDRPLVSASIKPSS